MTRLFTRYKQIMIQCCALLKKNFKLSNDAVNSMVREWGMEWEVWHYYHLYSAWHLHASVHPSIHLVTLYVLSPSILSLSKVVNYYYDGEHTYIPGELYDDCDDDDGDDNDDDALVIKHHIIFITWSVVASMLSPLIRRLWMWYSPSRYCRLPWRQQWYLLSISG